MAWYDDWLKKNIQGDINDLLKADGITTPNASEASTAVRGAFTADILPDAAEQNDGSKNIGRKSIIDDPYFENMSSQLNYKSKMSRLSNRSLKEVSVRDWLVSAIIQARVDTLLRFSRPEHRRFEMGYRFVKKDHNAEYSKQELEEIASLEDFIYHCGRKDGTPSEDRMLFGEFIKLVTRDAITFGHISIEKVKTRVGGLHRFRPLPAENMYLINKRMSRKQIEQQDKAAQQTYHQPLSDNDPKANQVVNEADNEYMKYV